MKRCRIWTLLKGLSAALLFLPLRVFAADDTPWKVSGFLSLVGGSVINGSLHETLSGTRIDCPCLITDWANAGVYEGSAFTFQPDSKAALQVSYNSSAALSFTSQVISRGSDATPNVQWAYFSYDIDDQWSVDVGRKRIPLYYYSDFQDLGFAFPWITPPGEVYGWESTNYNGASITHWTYWNYFQIVTSVFGGNETDHNATNFQTSTTQSVDSHWNDLRGAYVELSRDWWSFRATYLKTNVDWYYKDDQAHYKNRMEAYGISFNTDYDQWIFLSEVAKTYRQWPVVNDIGLQTISSFSIGAGRRFKNHWTIFVNYAGYKDRAEDINYQYAEFYTHSLTARYDLTDHSDIKIQWDNHDDKSIDYSGDANLIRVSYDLVF